MIMCITKQCLKMSNIWIKVSVFERGRRIFEDNDSLGEREGTKREREVHALISKYRSRSQDPSCKIQKIKWQFKKKNNISIFNWYAN